MGPILGGGGGALNIMHGRSHVTIDPRILAMPGRGTPDFHRPGRHYLLQARSAVKCWASRMKVSSILLKTAFEVDFLAYV